MEPWSITGVGGLLAICSYYDIKEKEIPLKPIYAMALADVVFVVDCIWRGEWNNLYSMLAGAFIGIFLCVISKATRGSLGMGDGLLVLVCGVALGFLQTLSLLFVAFFLSAVVSLLLLSMRKAGKKTEIPFVPFLFLGFVALSWLC